MEEEKDITVADVAQMALNMETKGMEFYIWAAQKFESDSIRQVFLRLAEEEKEHQRVFRKLLNFSENQETLGVNFRNYLNAITGLKDIFPHHSDITDERVKSPFDVLNIGIQAEKDAILLYQELFNKTNSQEVKDVISKLLEEEKMHLFELRNSIEEWEQGN